MGGEESVGRARWRRVLLRPMRGELVQRAGGGRERRPWGGGSGGLARPGPAGALGAPAGPCPGPGSSERAVPHSPALNSPTGVAVRVLGERSEVLRPALPEGMLLPRYGQARGRISERCGWWDVLDVALKGAAAVSVAAEVWLLGSFCPFGWGRQLMELCKNLSVLPLAGILRDGIRQTPPSLFFLCFVCPCTGDSMGTLLFLSQALV